MKGDLYIGVISEKSCSLLCSMNSYDSMSEDAYKKAKEDFVSGHSGTTMLEIAAVNLLLPVRFFKISVFSL